MPTLPPPLPLAFLPTPLQPMPRLSQLLGVELFVKRDDLTNGPSGGNKLRKLQWLLADAVAHGATHVITCGGLQSNHARATALAAAPLGLQAVLVLRTPHGNDADFPDPPTGNLLLDRIAGAELRPVDPQTYRERRGAVMATIAGELEAAGHVPYIIPEGGSNAIGSLGYASVVDEILAALPDAPPDTIVAATGSGGTIAGLALGIARSGAPIRAVGVAVCDDAPYFEAIARNIIAEAHNRFGAPADAANCFEILEGFQGRGYGLSTPEELAFLRETARLDGLVLDPAYTNKAFRGLVTTLRSTPSRFGRRVVFIHTGGIFGLFGDADAAAGLVASGS